MYFLDKYDSFHPFKKGLFLIFLFYFVSGGAGNQNSPADTSAINNLTRESWQLIQKGEFERSLACSKKAIEKAKAIGYEDGLVAAYLYTGIVHYYQSDYPRALNYYNIGLNLCKDESDESKKASYYTNIGIVYFTQNNIKKALEYFTGAMEAYKKLGEKKNLSAMYSNVGMAYHKEGRHKLALEYYMKGLAMCYETGSRQGYANTLSNIGSVYEDQYMLDSAIKYISESMKLNKELNSQTGLQACYINLGSLKFKIKEYLQAINYYKKGFEMAEQSRNMAHQAEALFGIAQSSARLNNYKDAYEYFVKYKQCNDSIFNLDKSRKLSDLRSEMDVKKRELELLAEQKIKDALVEKEKKIQKIALLGVSAGAFLLLIVAGLIFRNLQTNKRKNRMISEQKKLVEEKQKEILDSIRYAERIQKSLLPRESNIDKMLSGKDPSCIVEEGRLS